MKLNNRISGILLLYLFVNITIMDNSVDTDIISDCLENEIYQDINYLELEINKVSDRKLAYGFLLSLILTKKRNDDDINRLCAFNIPQELLEQGKECVTHYNNTMRAVYQKDLDSIMFIGKLFELLTDVMTIIPGEEDTFKELIKNNKEYIPYTIDYLLKVEGYEILNIIKQYN